MELYQPVKELPELVQINVIKDINACPYEIQTVFETYFLRLVIGKGAGTKMVYVTSFSCN